MVEYLDPGVKPSSMPCRIYYGTNKLVFESCDVWIVFSIFWKPDEISILSSNFTTFLGWLSLSMDIFLFPMRATKTSILINLLNVNSFPAVANYKT